MRVEMRANTSKNVCARRCMINELVFFTVINVLPSDGLAQQDRTNPGFVF